nr:putative CAAX amino terminal protease [Ipomoea batatas]GMD85965.1 putative CAAX amino terminal protease [Ipomoea batatas]
MWSGMALYVFSFHVPLSFGGLSAISNILHRPVLDPETEAISLLVIQTLELIGVLLLLRFPRKPQSSILEFFQAKQVSKERNWLLASAIGFGLLVFLVFLTSFISYRLVGPKDVNNPIVKEILASSSISLTACVLVYCVVTPFLEEIVYRRFFLTALSSTMKWQQAVIISSIVFSAVHFSAENFMPLFIIGSILGGSYCWSGNLCSSVVIHSLYNALTLLITYMS